MVEETAEVREWDKPLTEWNSTCCMEFMNWVHEYKKDNPDLKIEDAITAFRVVMDAGYCEEVTYERYRYGWTDSRGIFGNNGT